jgi:NADH-quinone oxidoreductase subunit F
MGISVGYNYIHGEIFEVYERFEASAGRGPRRRLAWANILGSDFSFQLHAHHGFGAYICGEETALLESLEGKKGQPRFKPPFPASFGLYGKPTTINNTETFAAVPWIIATAARPTWSAASPTTAAPRSSRWWAMSSARQLRNPAGHAVREAAGTGRWRQGRAQAQGRDPGRSSAPVLPAATMMDMHDGLRRHRQGRLDAGLGRGDRDGRDPLHGQEPAAPVLLLQHESCGQCTPCREGTGWLWRMVDRIEHGKGRAEDLALLDSVADNIKGRTICALGDAAAMPVRGMLKHFRDEFVHHIEHKTCMVPVCLT